jgi:hypothetical protein
VSDSTDWATITEGIGQWIARATGLPVLWSYEGGNRPSAPYVQLDITGSRSVSDDWMRTKLNVFTFAPVAFTIDPATGIATAIAHGLKTGDGPIGAHNVGGALPTNLSAIASYWIHKLTDDTFQLAPTFYQSMTAGHVTVADAGSGTNTIVGQAESTRQGTELVRAQMGHRQVTLRIQVFAADGSGLAALAACENVKGSADLHAEDVDAAGAGIGTIGDATLVPGHRGGILEPRALMTIGLHVASQLEDFVTYIERLQIGSTALGIPPAWVPGPPQ